jgi:hypothetical protein
MDTAAVDRRRADIKRRYKARADKGKGTTVVTITTLRVAELRRLFQSRYGHVLPDDDAGRDDALVMAHHLARGQDPERRIGRWLGLWAPWMTDSEIAKLISKVIAKPIRWRADKLGARLRVTEAERQTLNITTIGSIEFTKAERLARRRQHARSRDETRRRRKGAKPRQEYEVNSISRKKPWEALGMSRRSWYRAGKPAVAQVRAQHT